MNTLNKSKAIGHCRVSSKKQAQEGESLDVQEGIVTALVEYKGWELVHIWKESYSGRKNNRPVFQEILDYLDANPGTIQYYVFRAIDRFTRGGTGIYEHMKNELAKRGVEMVDTMGMIQASQNTLADLDIEYDWSRYSPSAVTEAVVSTTSKQEITTMQTRMIGQEIRLTRQGYKVRAPQDGYRNVKVYDENGKKRTIMETEPSRAKYLLAMFTLRAEGQLTDAEIVDRVNAMGYRTRTFKRWNKGHTKIVGTSGGVPLIVKRIQEIVQRPIYAGFTLEKWTNGKPIKTKFDGLVSLDIFNKANRGKIFIQQETDGTYTVLYDYHPERIVLKKTKYNPMFPYKNVIACPECGNPLLGSSSRNKRGNRFAYYHCSRGHKYVSFSKAFLEKVVEDYVNDLHFNSESLFVLNALLIDRFHDRQSEILQETAAAGQSVVELELLKKQAIDAFKTATSDLMRHELEREAVDLDNQIQAARTQRTKLEIVESDIDDFIRRAKTVIEHPSKLLLNTANMRQQELLYSLVFDELPTVAELDSGTPKLSWYFRLSEDSGGTESVLAGPPGLEPGTAVLETAVLPLNYRP